MFLAKIIVDAIVRKDGTNEIVGTGTVTLPDLENAVEEVKGLGIGTHEHVIQSTFNSMTLQLKFLGISKNVNLGSGKILNLVIKASTGGIETDTHEMDEKEIVVSCKGYVKKRTGGELGKGSKNEPEVEIALSYYKLEIDGEVSAEIDVYNRIAVIDGEDVYQKTKSILS